MPFAPLINTDFKPTGRIFDITDPSSVCFGKTGEALKFLSWNGVVLMLEGETKPRTFAIGEVTERTTGVTPGVPINISPFATNVLDLINTPLRSENGSDVIVRRSCNDFIIVVNGEEYRRTNDNLTASYALNMLRVSYKRE